MGGGFVRELRHGWGMSNLSRRLRAVARQIAKRPPHPEARSSHAWLAGYRVADEFDAEFTPPTPERKSGQ
jgi:hypothetical protein